MADTKISALPASTTPLAGTEVLPIVQSGETRKVTVADLTAGRVVSASTLTGTTSVSSPTFAGTNNTLTAFVDAASVNGVIVRGSTGSPANVTELYGGGIKGLTVDSTGNATISIGNLVIGTSGKGITLPGGITWTSGSGSPEGVVTAPVGSLYSRSDGGLLTSLYVKELGSGNTGWVGK